MAYRAKHIEEFIEKVNREALEAAQAVFDKHNEELQQMVANQVLDGQKFLIGMGTATIREPNRDLRHDYAEKFLSVVANTQYSPFESNNWNVGFSLSDVDKTTTNED